MLPRLCRKPGRLGKRGPLPLPQETEDMGKLFPSRSQSQKDLVWWMKVSARVFIPNRRDSMFDHGLYRSPSGLISSVRCCSLGEVRKRRIDSEAVGRHMAWHETKLQTYVTIVSIRVAQRWDHSSRDLFNDHSEEGNGSARHHTRPSGLKHPPSYTYCGRKRKDWSLGGGNTLYTKQHRGILDKTPSSIAGCPSSHIGSVLSQATTLGGCDDGLGDIKPSKKLNRSASLDV